MSLRTALLFPGQGSQFPGMGRALYEAFPQARAAFQEADEALGWPLSELCFSGSEEELRRTENTQPALLTVSVAAHRALAARGVRPVAAAGHSLGEYSALVAAGSLDLATAVRLVRNRGRYMQEAVPEGQGSMAAVLGLDDEVVQEVCADVRQAGTGVVEPANYNAPGQVVIAGSRAAVEAAMQAARARGARRVLPLNVSAPFHCSLMAPAAERLAVDLAGVAFADPAFPVVRNIDAEPLTRGEQVAESLRLQVTSPVRWVDCLRRLEEMGCDTWVEVGAGRVLAGLAKRTLGARVCAAHEPAEIEAVAVAAGA